MSAVQMLAEWRYCVKDRLLPGLSGHQLDAVCNISLAMALARDSRSGVVAAYLPGEAQPASRRRQVERLVANDRCIVAALSSVLSRQITGNFAGMRLVVMLDETTGPGDLRCLMLSLGYHHRALPLVWCCYREGRLPASMPVLAGRLIDAASGALPSDAQITLLVDRGLAWPALLDRCRLAGWHFVFRVQGSTRVMLLSDENSGEYRADHWTKRRNDRGFAGSVRVFKKAGWRDGVYLLASWEQPCAEPWLLISDQPSLSIAVRQYAKRMWCEQEFRDSKSGGFQWQRSRVRDPSRAARVLLLIALAMILTVMLGAMVIKRGLRRRFDPRGTRRYSYLQLGFAQMQELLLHDGELRLSLHLYPP